MITAPDVHTAKLRLQRQLGLVEERIKIAKEAGDEKWRAELIAEALAVRARFDEVRAKKVLP